MRHFGSVLAVLAVIFTAVAHLPAANQNHHRLRCKSVLGRRRCTSPKNRESSGSTAWMRRSCSSAARRRSWRAWFPGKWKSATPAARRCSAPPGKALISEFFRPSPARLPIR